MARNPSPSSYSPPWSDKLFNLMSNALPIESLKDIPKIMTILVVSLSLSLTLSAFIYSYIYNYQTLTDEIFLSLTKDAGSCSRVPITVNDIFMADTNGNWEGNIDFEYRNAIYSMTLSNFNGNEQEFNHLLHQGFDVIDILGENAKHLDLAENLITWMAGSITAKMGQQAHTLQFTGDPKIVFNSIYLYSSMSNEAGQCKVPATITYDRSVGVFTISYPIDDYLASPPCMDIANPYHFGYTGMGTEFTIPIDMQSAITAIGVNTAIILPSQLEKVPYSETSFLADGINYTAAYYFYPRYPGMTPLFCVLLPPDQLVCSIRYGSIYAYPVFNHLGASFEKPEYCDCKTEIGKSLNCSTFYLLPGLIFYDYSNNSDTSYLDMVKLITSTYDRNINHEAYNITADTVLSHTTDKIWRKEAYSFCTKNTTRGCSVIAIATGNPPLYTVSPYYFQVPYGSCNNSFTISSIAQDKLLSTPPTPLTEIYYECSRSKEDNLMSALGISVGNTVLVRYILIILIGSLLFLYNRLISFETYSNKEIQHVLHFFAFNLLLARDHRYPLSQDQQQQQEGGKQQGDEKEEKEKMFDSLIYQIQHELSMRQNIHRFHSKNIKDKENEQKQERFHLSESLLVLEERNSQKTERRTFSKSSTSTSQFNHGETLLNPFHPHPDSE